MLTTVQRLAQPVFHILPALLLHHLSRFLQWPGEVITFSLGLYLVGRLIYSLIDDNLFVDYIVPMEFVK